jgi:serine/threonine protein kinase
VRSRTSSTSSSDSSLVSDSTEDDAEKENICGPDADADDDDNNDNDDGSDNYTDYTDSEEKLFAYLHDFPVQLIFQEKCFGTFDDLLMRNQTSSQEIIAALFQITIILATYQKMFNFTHNDLHTNNIMYVKTDLEYIHYKLNDTIYKVPTHGRIFKLIDFGRAIYQFNGHQFCSDSFSENGDANTQYNCEPYMNPKKPRIDPNPSFDLCRLGCSLYDFTMESDSKELKSLVDSWCEDDYGKNILYKSSGEERYPGFKLYKMIARCVNNLVPKDILCQPIFAKYRLASIDDQTPLIDIDAMPTYMSNHK